MILDANLKVSAAQQITGDADSTSSIDFDSVSPARDLGTGEVLGFGIFVTANGTNTDTAIINLVESAAANLGSPVVLASLTLVNAELTPGKKHFLALPPGKPTLRYIGLAYDITGTVDFTVDAIFMAASSFGMQTYSKKGYTIS